MRKLVVSASPHIQTNLNTGSIMLDVIIALVPAMLASVIFFGINAVVLLTTCTSFCVVLEYLSRRIMRRQQTIWDLSAVVTGVLIAFNMPPTVSPFIAMFGCLVAIVVVKQMFGGIGSNFVNPALAARIILLNSFPSKMTQWVSPFDAVSSATPLGDIATGENVAYLDLFIGNTAGCVGETSAFALLIGGVYLVVKKVISPIIPLTYMGTVFALSFVLGRDPLFEILSGGLMLGAIFMATDYATSPIHKKAKFVFAVGCAILTVLIRVYGSLPEGVSYAIVLMNILVPLIERCVKVKSFGNKKCWRRKK